MRLRLMQSEGRFNNKGRFKSRSTGFVLSQVLRVGTSSAFSRFRLRLLIYMMSMA